MADVDIDPFGGMEHPTSRGSGEHESRPEDSMEE